MSKLAINGGKPVRTKPFPSMSTIGVEEEEAILRVLDSGTLSAYRGNSGPNFLGGPEVQALEKEFAEKFNVKYAIAVNSCTSALQIACGAVGLAPRDEVIVTPWSMSCSATAPLLWNAIPIFADIEEDYFCLDSKSIEKRITPRTKAIIVVDLFGQPYDAERINEIANRHNLSIIEDAAQTIGGVYRRELTNKDNGIFPDCWDLSVDDLKQIEIDTGWKSTLFAHAGALGNIGVFSFTTGKIITSGEGGMIVTNNQELAQRCQMIRNHAEAVWNDKTSYVNPNNMLGFNMRMTELQAAILRCQLRKLVTIVNIRQINAGDIRYSLSQISAIEPCINRDYSSHVYYAQAFKWDKEKADGLHRDKFIEAVKAELAPEQGRENEGVRIGCGYIKPLYLFPLFQQMGLYGGSPYPWYSEENFNPSKQFKEYVENYKQGSCPVAERLWKDELFVHTMLGMNLTREDLDDFCNAFHKVWENREELK